MISELERGKRQADFAPASPGRVVIAEDDPDMRAYLELALGAAGYDVQGFETGTAALAACIDRPPDAVLADVVMPGCGGFELIHRLRSDELTAAIPVLILSGHAEEQSRIAGFAAGADDYLIKPIGARELLARVDSAIRLAQLRQTMAKRQQADFESLFATAFDGIIVVGGDGKALTANAMAQKQFGYGGHEFAGLPVAWLMPQDHTEAMDWHRHARARVQTERLAGAQREFKCQRQDGSRFVAEIGLGRIDFRNRDCLVINVRDITERVQTQARLKAAMESLQALSERFTKAQEDERRNIAFELHEQLGQEISTLKLHLEMLANPADSKFEDHRKDALELLAVMLQRVRNMTLDLRPPQLDDLGLFSALRTHCRRQEKLAGWIMHCDIPSTAPRPRAEIEVACFRVAQEALTNIMRYAKATEVWIRLDESETQLHLSLRDNGIGFDANALGNGRPVDCRGLIGIAERMRQVGGQLSIHSRPQQGTEICAVFPLVES